MLRSFNILKNHLYRYSNKPFSKLTESYKIHTKNDDYSSPNLNPFLISTERGFLPRTDPVLDLPKKYSVINSLLERMRWHQPDGSEGLLAKNIFGETLKKELTEIDVSGEKDTMVQLAIYRDLCYLTSAYLLEECHHNYLKNGKYGLGRDHLPKNLAIPLVKISEMLDMRPFLEYNTGYALNNFFKINPLGGHDIGNIDIFRSFVNIKSEAGFILVHVAINQYSGMLVKSGVDVLKAAENKNRQNFDMALQEMKEILMFMNQEFERMFFESNPHDYNIFRTFILGITNQPMFPKGVIYEGCFDNKPQFYRGESGANDSIIPFSDNVIQITEFMPRNPLTDILRDFRSYRPKAQQEFLQWSEDTAKNVGVLEFAKGNSESMLALLEVADQIRAFRHRHWILTNMYIINLSTHPVATGGSPITTWLPNQLLTVIDFIRNHRRFVKDEDIPSFHLYNLDAIIRRCESDERLIRKQRDTKRTDYKQ